MAKEPKDERRVKVTGAFEAAVMEASATLGSAQAITDAVNAKLGTKYSRRTVANILGRVKVERSDIAKNVVRSHLSKTLFSDLDVLLKSRDQLEKAADKWFADFEAAKTPELARLAAREHRQTVNALREVANTRLHYSGADIPDGPNDEVAAAAERVRSRIDRLASAGREGPEAREAGADTR